MPPRQVNVSGTPLSPRIRNLVRSTLDPFEDVDPAVATEQEYARQGIERFATYTMPEYRVNWHHRVMFHWLSKWIAGEITRLMVFVPPQHGKSEIVSRRLPSYLLGKFPDSRIIACSYNDTMAGLLNRDVQKIIDSDRYRELFPGTELWNKAVTHKAKGSWLRNSTMFEVVGRKGSYYAAGVRGGITGLPFHWGIIDDIHKDDKEANSPTVREDVWNWYTTTFATRKTEAQARVLITLTRWHQDDLPGRLLELARRDPKADQWTVVRFPAILEDEGQRMPGDPRRVGDALWEERHPVRELEVERLQAGPVKWSAVYQQDPSPARGTVFERDHFRYFATEPHPRGVQLLLLPPAGEGGEPGVPPPQPRRVLAADCRWFQTCDAADTVGSASAFTCVVTFCVTPQRDLLVWHVWRGKLPYPARYNAIIGLRSGVGAWDDGSHQWQPPFVPWPKRLVYQAMEFKASGIALVQQGAAEGKPFRVLRPGNMSKVERCSNVTTLYHNGKVYHRQGQPWLTSFEAEVLNFPSGTFADQVDCLAYGGILLAQDSILTAGVEGDLICWPPPRGVETEGNGATEEHSTAFDYHGQPIEFEDERPWYLQGGV